MAKSRKRRSTEQLVSELRDFHHDEAADRLAWLQSEHERLSEIEWMYNDLQD